MGPLNSSYDKNLESISDDYNQDISLGFFNKNKEIRYNPFLNTKNN